jgi:Zn-dependent protease
MRGSLKVLTIAGIGIYIHWTFLLLLAWVFYTGYTPERGVPGALVDVGFILAVFGCVTLHELGHALTAARFGVKTRDITMLPIGGVARLERIPENPLEEFLVAIAGPAVNVAIAAVLGALLLATRGFTAPTADATHPGALIAQIGFVQLLLMVNVFLVLFNMIPAFPMDGGRVLRAALASRMPHDKATQIAAAVGQVLAVGFGVLGLMTGNPFLALIAVFIFLGAGAEAQAAQARGAFQDLPVRDAMMTDFRALTLTDTLAEASRELLAGSQEDFPVMSEGRVAGVLPRADLLKALASRGRDAPVTDVMRRDCMPVDEGEMLDAVYRRMQETGCQMLPVARRGEVVGMVSLANISDLVMVRSALRRAAAGRTMQAGAAARPRPAT